MLHSPLNPNQLIPYYHSFRIFYQLLLDFSHIPWYFPLNHKDHRYPFKFAYRLILDLPPWLFLAFIRPFIFVITVGSCWI